MSTPQTHTYDVDIEFPGATNDLKDDNPIVQRFEWASTINNGFIARASLLDPGFDLLDKVFTSDYLKYGRNSDHPSVIRFRIKWRDGASTPWRTAIITDMDAKGGGAYSGQFEFIAVDPLSYYLNRGKSSGKVFKGKIGGQNGVIGQVLDEYLPPSIPGVDMGISTKVGETTDQPSLYWMMRQTPKVFIMSLLDWSSSLTKNKTSWLVASGEDESQIELKIEESHTPQLRDPAAVDGGSGPLVFTYGGTPSAGVSDILSWELLTSSFITVSNSKLTTGGISAISGEYLDIKSDEKKEEKVFVKDKNTENKANASFGGDRGFAKPSVEDSGWSNVMAVPEFSAGDVGKKYSEYIDGRARQVFIDLLKLTMRIKVSVRGEPRLFDSTDLGRSKVSLSWLGIEDQSPRFMDGEWLLYGWNHRLSSDWRTDVYLARLDFDAAAVPG